MNKPHFLHPIDTWRAFRESNCRLKESRVERDAETKNRKKKQLEKVVTETRGEVRQALKVFFAQGVTALSLLGLSVGATGHSLGWFEKNEAVEFQETEPRDKPSPEPIQENPLRRHLPEMRVLPGQEFNFQKPENLSMSAEDFRSLILPAIDPMKRFISETIEPSMPAQRSIPRELMLRLVSLLTAQHPEFSQDYTEFARTWTGGLDYVIAFLNRYLNVVDHHMIHFVGKSGKTHLHILDITGSEVLEVSHPDQTFTIPVIELKGAGINDSSEYGYRMGVYNYLSGFIEVYPEKISTNFDTELAKVKGRRDYPRFNLPVNRDRALEEYREEIVYHEAVHALLDKLFPSITRPPRAEGIINGVQLKIPIGDGEIVDLSGNYSFAQINELCGVAAQLATTKLDIPLIHWQFMSNEEAHDERGQYALVHRILPVMTINLAPDGSLIGNTMRQQAIEHYRETGEVNAMNAIAIIAWAPYSRENTQKTGEVLYDLAFRTLKQLAPQFEGR